MRSERSVRAERRTLPRRSARETVQPHARGAREAPHTSRRSARQTVQPHARNQNEQKVLEDQIAICE